MSHQSPAARLTRVRLEDSLPIRRDGLDLSWADRRKLSESQNSRKRRTRDPGGSQAAAELRRESGPSSACAAVGVQSLKCPFGVVYPSVLVPQEESTWSNPSRCGTAQQDQAQHHRDPLQLIVARYGKHIFDASQIRAALVSSRCVVAAEP